MLPDKPKAAAQAREAVRAHETAYCAAMVPPPLIDANRALRASLASTNHLGQTSASIADADAEYERMWAQDADAMYAYAGSSATAATVTPFPSPPSGMDAAALRYGASAHARCAGSRSRPGSQMIPAIPNALRELSSSRLSASPLAAVLPALAKLRTLRLGFARVGQGGYRRDCREGRRGSGRHGFCGLQSRNTDRQPFGTARMAEGHRGNACRETPAAPGLGLRSGRRRRLRRAAVVSLGALATTAE